MTMKIELYEDKQYQWRWRLVATNNECIADGGQGYEDKFDCLQGALLTLGGAYRAVDNKIVRNNHNGPEYIFVQFVQKEE